MAVAKDGKVYLLVGWNEHYGNERFVKLYVQKSRAEAGKTKYPGLNPYIVPVDLPVTR